MNVKKVFGWVEKYPWIAGLVVVLVLFAVLSTIFIGDFLATVGICLIVAIVYLYIANIIIGGPSNKGPYKL